MLTSRVLPRDEWGRVSSVPLDVALPDTSRVVVVEKDGAIIASWIALNVLHLHALEVDAEYRKNPAVFGRLMRQMRDVVLAHEATGAFTTAESDEVREMLKSYGAERVVGEGYVVRL